VEITPIAGVGANNKYDLTNHVGVHTLTFLFNRCLREFSRWKKPLQKQVL